MLKALDLKNLHSTRDESQIPAKCDAYLLSWTVAQLTTPGGLATSPDLWLTGGLEIICVSIYRFRHVAEQSHSSDSSPKISMAYGYLH